MWRIIHIKKKMLLKQWLQYFPESIYCSIFLFVCLFSCSLTTLVFLSFNLVGCAQHFHFSSCFLFVLMYEIFAAAVSLEYLFL